LKEERERRDGDKIDFCEIVVVVVFIIIYVYMYLLIWREKRIWWGSEREKKDRKEHRREVSFLSQTESAFLQILPLFSLLSSNFPSNRKRQGG
jgi:hypothetical protein